MREMRLANRVMIAVGSLLVILVVLGLVVGAIQDAEVSASPYYQARDRSLGAGQIVALILGALLVLVGVIQHQGDHRRGDRD